MEKRLFTSESVTEGHPDKICDQISDAVLDALYEQDPYSRVACETLTNTGFVMVMGEITTKASIDIPQIVRDTVVEIGYDSSEKGFDGNTCAVMVALDKQSADIAMGVDKALEAKEGVDKDDEDLGAGDQGMMFGYATNETEEYMPYSAALAQKLSKQLTKVRKDGTLSYLRPDGKTQVTVEYDENNKPIRLDAIVVSSQHAPEVSQEQIHEDIKKYVIDAIVDPAMVDADTKIFINPTGRFVIGGPNGDSGLTGRKIIVDTYGGAARHGGGAFSGKDCTKVDRSAAYAARYVAKNIVAAGIADRCEIQLSYAIGVAHPTSICVDTFGTGKLNDEKIVEIIRENFDLRPNGFINMLNLRRPIYKQTASYGHFGRTDLNLPWEQTDKADILKKYLIEDENDPDSENDFGNNIIPNLLRDDRRMYAYHFNGYWKDVGTIPALWEANMEVLDPEHSGINLFDENWKIYSRNSGHTGHFIGNNAEVTDSMITDGCVVKGTVKHSILFGGVVVEEGAVVEDAVVMGDTVIKRGAKVTHCIVAEGVTVGCDAVIGEKPAEDVTGDVATIAPGVTIGDRAVIGPKAMVYNDVEEGQEQC